LAGAVKGLGEVNLWVEDLDKMTSFYERTLGLEPIFKNRRHVFLKVADGYGGHPQAVALFNSRYDGRAPPDVRRTSLNHLAFSIDKEDFQTEKKRLESSGLNVRVELHKQPHWRSMYFNDPEGNQVELVAYDEGVR
jgi:catechol-2,3-dioxygenase